MTLILAANSREGVWLLADRRLSRNGKPVRDDACKILELEGTDGVALLGYAGLGATALGTEPSKWMSTVLRGRGRYTIEKGLGILTAALRDQLPKHLVPLAGSDWGHHAIIAPALIDDRPQLYTIEVVTGPRGKGLSVEYRRHVTHFRDGAGPPVTPRFALAGSGGPHVDREMEWWYRPLLRLLHRTDRGRTGPHVVADYLAKLNYSAHLGADGGSVGPRCIVVWRFRKGGGKRGFRAGGFQYYTGTERDYSSPALPSIVNGHDSGQMVEAIASAWRPSGVDGFDKERRMAALTEEIAKLDWGPKWDLE